MNADYALAVSRRAEIVPEDVSGGANTSHTIVVDALSSLLAAVPVNADADAYESAAIEDNALGKSTDGSRRRTFRYLKELYLLRPDSLLFRALRDLWPMDPAAARSWPDRAHWLAIACFVRAAPHPGLQSRRRHGGCGLRRGRRRALPGELRRQHARQDRTEHLLLVAADRSSHRELPRPQATSTRRLPSDERRLRALLGHLEGVRGLALLDTVWARTLDQPIAHLQDLAVAASQQGLVDVRSLGGVFEVDFSLLLRPFEGELL